MERERDQKFYSQIGNDQAGQATEDREHQAFRERLADDSLPGCAESKTNGSLRTPGRSASKKQVGDIGARNEQHQSANREQNAEAVAVVLFHEANADTRGDHFDDL